VVSGFGLGFHPRPRQLTVYGIKQLMLLTIAKVIYNI